MIKFFGDSNAEKLEDAEKLVAKYKYDKMTGLKMRIDFDEAFERMIQSRIYDSRYFTFALIDINGLHKLNRDKGFLAGDDLIKSVALSLKDKFEESSVYRIGGDEFGILCSNITRSDAIKIFKKMDNLNDFCYGVIDSDEIDWRTHDCRSVFLFVDSLVIDAKANRKNIR